MYLHTRHDRIDKTRCHTSLAGTYFHFVRNRWKIPLPFVNRGESHDNSRLKLAMKNRSENLHVLDVERKGSFAVRIPHVDHRNLHPADARKYRIEFGCKFQNRVDEIHRLRVDRTHDVPHLRHHASCDAFLGDEMVDDTPRPLPISHTHSVLGRNLQNHAEERKCKKPEFGRKIQNYVDEIRRLHVGGTHSVPVPRHRVSYDVFSGDEKVVDIPCALQIDRSNYRFRVYRNPPAGNKTQFSVLSVGQ